MKFWEYRFVKKKYKIYDKFEIATKQRELKIFPMCIFVFFLTGATWYYHAIYKVFTYFTSFGCYEDDIFELFLMCTSKDPNFAENMTNFAKKSLKTFNSAEFMEFVFYKSLFNNLCNAPRPQMSELCYQIASLV